ncbi:MAG: hypothetical protein Q6354_04110 [Candidatus Brocadiales bacterium]|nr:hypothetical protein [Candidatus Brocadiales bacterium]
MEGYVRLKEVAKFLGISTMTLKRLVSESRAGLNNLPFYQYGRAANSPLSFKLSEVDRWARNHQPKRRQMPTLAEATKPRILSR